MSLAAILNPVLLLITIAVAGFIISKRISVTNEVKQFVTFIVINLALPGVVIQSIFSLQLDTQIWRYLSIVFIAGFSLNLIGLAIGYGLTRAFRYPPFVSRQAAVLSGLGNTGFIGIPFLALMLGAEAGAFASIYDAATMSLTFTVGIMLLQSGKFQKNQLKALLNAPFLTLLVSISMVYLNLTPVNFVMDLSEIFAGLSAPLAMIYIGLLLGSWKKESLLEVKEHYSRFLIIVISTKVILLPMLAFAVVPLFDLPLTIKQVIIIQAGMPSLLLGLVLIERYKGNVQVAITVILATSVLYLCLVPIFTYLSSLL
ncbi:AEC family transporter [Alkalicoccus daliensis]|uniref:Membrane transport protein n=1 Tax=Alkalicoccus daliensis TaxID=745820 RepID=A0A1H0G8C5_9BACI|nr:AEC family transporter [Alkalicoccus daliensis]SDO03163.1 Membrane transport protein [Alkalicoccus daliensis]